MKKNSLVTKLAALGLSAALGLAGCGGQSGNGGQNSEVSDVAITAEEEALAKELLDRNVTANDLSVILDKADIKQIYVNGKTAYKYYVKYSEEKTGRPAICLPSTSPANAAWSVERLTDAWSCIKKEIK